MSAGFGTAIAVVAAFFVARAVRRSWDEVDAALGRAELGWLVLAAILSAIGMLAIALPWGSALRLVGGRMPRAQILARYFVGEIGKYIPGAVWPLLGRGELAVRYGVGRSAAYASVALSLIGLYLAAAFVAVPVLLALLADEGVEAANLAVLALLPLGLAAVHPSVLRRVVGLVQRIARRQLSVEVPRWGATAALVVRYAPAWAAIGAGTWAVARALDPSAPFLEVMAATLLSWLAGFLFVPVPGGVGVREAAFVAVASSLDPGIAAATSIASRLLFVTVDCLGALAGSAALGSRRCRRRS